MASPKISVIDRNASNNNNNQSNSRIGNLYLNRL